MRWESRLLASMERTSGETYHYWAGVADAYSAMVAELDVRESRS